MFAILKTIYTIKVLRGFPAHLKKSCSFIVDRIPVLCQEIRSYSDTPNRDSKKAVVKVQGTDTEQRLRVRLARPSDVPRVLKFVREHVRVWPGPLAPNNLVLDDYVARTLAQGHSMLAEEHSNATRSEILGLALAAAICSWDADILERWASCLRCARSKRLVNFTAHCLRAPKLHENYGVDRILQLPLYVCPWDAGILELWENYIRRCTRSKRLMNFTAHCLRAPKLHENYGVERILQVTLIVPPDKPKSAEIAQALAKNAIKRGKEAGFPLVRFDITKDSDAKSLEELNLKKEWFISYKIIDVALKEDAQGCKQNTNKDETSNVSSGNYVSVYTAKP